MNLKKYNDKEENTCVCTVLWPLHVLIAINSRAVVSGFPLTTRFNFQRGYLCCIQPQLGVLRAAEVFWGVCRGHSTGLCHHYVLDSQDCDGYTS